MVAMILTYISDKGNFYLEPRFSTLLLNNQEILVFNSGSVIIMSLCKMYLEERTLELFWMDMNPSLMKTRRVFLRVTPVRRDIKDLQITLRFIKS